PARSSPSAPAARPPSPSRPRTRSRSTPPARSTPSRPPSTRPSPPGTARTSTWSAPSRPSAAGTPARRSRSPRPTTRSGAPRSRCHPKRTSSTSTSRRTRTARSSGRAAATAPPPPRPPAAPPTAAAGSSPASAPTCGGAPVRGRRPSVRPDHSQSPEGFPVTNARPEGDQTGRGGMADYSPMGEPEQSHAGGATRAAAVRPAGSVSPDGAARTAARPALAARWAARLRGHFRSPGAPRLWFELALTGVGYWFYSLVRNAVPTQELRAQRNAHGIWHLEQQLGVAAERSVNHWFDHITWLITGLDYDYATLHFIVTIGVLVWLFRSHPGRYAAARAALFVTTAIALVGFYFFPLAPPRLMTDGGFIDTVLEHHTWGSMASGNLASMD